MIYIAKLALEMLLFHCIYLIFSVVNNFYIILNEEFSLKIQTLQKHTEG